MFGKLLTNQKIAHKIVKPYVYKALREGLKTHDNGKIQNLRGFDSLSLRRRNQLINILTETNKNLNPASSTLITTRKKNNKPVQFPIYWWTFFQRA